MVTKIEFNCPKHNSLVRCLVNQDGTNYYWNCDRHNSRDMEIFYHLCLAIYDSVKSNKKTALCKHYNIEAFHDPKKGDFFWSLKCLKD